LGNNSKRQENAEKTLRKKNNQLDGLHTHTPREKIVLGFVCSASGAVEERIFGIHNVAWLNRLVVCIRPWTVTTTTTKQQQDNNTRQQRGNDDNNAPKTQQ